jgi:hypothetical protein
MGHYPVIPIMLVERTFGNYRSVEREPQPVLAGANMCNVILL